MDFLNKRLRAEIVALGKSIDAFRDQKERDQQKRDAEESAEQQVPLWLGGQIYATTKKTKAEETDDRSRHYLTVWLQVMGIVGTFLTLGVGIVVGGIYLLQLQTMDRTFKELQRQTKMQQESMRLSFGTHIRVTASLYQLQPNGNAIVVIQLNPTIKRRRVIDLMIRAATIDFRTDPPPRGADEIPIVPADAPLKNYAQDCKFPTTCTRNIVRMLPTNGYKDYIAGRGELYAWGTGTYADDIGHSTYTFCTVVAVNESGKVVDSIGPNGQPSFAGGKTKPTLENKWQDCHY